LVVTTGEDEFVRFWDTSLQLVSEYSVSQLFPENSYTAEGGKNKKDISIQSIDIFACRPPPTMNVSGEVTTGYEKDGTKLLLGTRNGAVIEVTLGSEFKTLQASPGELGRDIEKPGEIYDKKETYQVKYIQSANQEDSVSP
jgi:hypothetical protein